MSRRGFSLPNTSEIAAVRPDGFRFWAIPTSVLYKSPGYSARSFALRMFVMFVIFFVRRALAAPKSPKIALNFPVERSRETKAS